MPEEFEPAAMDIICGRGCQYSTRPGNKIFANIVQSHLQEYQEARTRIDKTMVVAQVLERVLETGARFLKKDKSTQRWMEMNREQSHSKCGHAIRDTIRLQEKSGKITSSTSTTPLRHSAEAHKTPMTEKIFSQKRVRSYNDIFVAHAPKSLIHDTFAPIPIIDNDCVDNNRTSIRSSCFGRLSIQSNGSMLASVLQAVDALNESPASCDTFDDTPLPAMVSLDNFDNIQPISLMDDVAGTAVTPEPATSAPLVKEDFREMYNILFSS